MGDLLPEALGEEDLIRNANYDEVAVSVALFQSSLYGLLIPVQHFDSFFAISSHHFLL
jgi:hypothetical protein